MYWPDLLVLSEIDTEEYLQEVVHISLTSHTPSVRDYHAF